MVHDERRLTHGIWQRSVFGSWLLKERWIDLLDSALRSCARFNSGRLCLPPLNLCCLGRRRCCGFKAEKAEGAWFCAERGHWPPASCINFLSFTFPSRKPAPVALAHSPPVLHALQREAALQILLERLGFGEIKKRRRYTLKLRQLFSAVEGGLAAMPRFVLRGTSVQGCSDERGVWAVTGRCIPRF